MCKLLRGESTSSFPFPPELVAREARLHGVEGLLLTVVQPAPAALREGALAFAAWEMRHRGLLVRALEALEAAGIPAILLKGAALAYSLYPDPALRTRADSDLLVAAESAPIVQRVLANCGFTQVPGVPSYQSSFVRTDPDGSMHALDVHWRINNSELLARTFDYQELAGATVALPRLAAVARGPSLVHSLLIACMHRATHKHHPYRVDGQDRHDPDRMIWLYDLHLLAAQLNEAEWCDLIGQATRKGLRAVTFEGLARARECFGTCVPEFVWHALQADAGTEAPARYLATSALRRTWMDIRAMPTWRRRIGWLRDFCFPPAAYMRGKYARTDTTWLSFLYVQRAIGGLCKRLARSAGFIGAP